MADLPKPAGKSAVEAASAASAPGTGKTETKSRVQEMAQTLKESRAERLRKRDELAYSPAVLGENVTKVFGARIATNVERELTDVFGSKIGASIREARRAEPGKKLSTFGRTYLSQLTTSIGGMGIIGEGIANRLRDQRKFEDDPQKEFEKIKGNFIAVSKDLKQINENFEKLKKSQEEVAKEVKKTTNLITDLNNTATRLERDFKEFQDVNFRQFKENVETRLSKLEGMAEMPSATGISSKPGKVSSNGPGGGIPFGIPLPTNLLLNLAKNPLTYAIGGLLYAAYNKGQAIKNDPKGFAEFQRKMGGGGARAEIIQGPESELKKFGPTAPRSKTPDQLLAERGYSRSCDTRSCSP